MQWKLQAVQLQTGKHNETEFRYMRFKKKKTKPKFFQHQSIPLDDSEIPHCSISVRLQHNFIFWLKLSDLVTDSANLTTVTLNQNL